MTTKYIIILILWLIPVIVAMVYHIKLMIQGGEYSLFDIVGGLLAMIFFSPIVYVIGLFWVLDSIKINKKADFELDFQGYNNSGETKSKREIPIPPPTEGGKNIMGK